MPLNSPRKVVPLSSGDDGPSRRSAPTFTKRAFFCGVVVEGPNDGADLSEDVQDLVASLGDKIPSAKDYEQTRAAPASSAQIEGQTRPRALTNTSALADLINELVVTERTYVQRLRILKNSYADPLRSYAKSKDTAILGLYESRTLFGNIDYIVPANEAFLHDLEQMMSRNGVQTVGGIGDVALRHFKELQNFECYKGYYTRREEAQEIFKAEMSKKSGTGFAAFVERIKYSTNDVKNRVGLRELLMEPVQRIPRYTLLFQSMIKLMGANDPQRVKLMEAKEYASRIALAEADNHTRLAATMNCLATSIEGFPPALISSSRRFIDCLDVVDNVVDTVGMSPYGSMSAGAGASTSVNASVSGGSLQCTLFLFDDKLMIVKRSGNDKTGRSLAGLDDVERVANSGLVSGKSRNLPSIRRNGMSFRGVVDVTEVNITDISGADMHLYLENPPLDQTDRWAGRPFRVLSAVLPGAVNLDSSRLEDEKRRFIENLWRAQARYRTRIGQSVALRADEQEVESRAGRTTVARTYFNVYQRTMFLKEPKKTKVVLHIDSLGNADPLPIGIDGPPYVVIQVQPMAGELCRYVVHSCDPSDDADDDIVQSSRVPSRVIQTIHQYGLFKFKTDNPSRPATPSGPNRSRAHIFGLDVISRNLFGSKNKESPSDSMGRHMRTKSALSRTSTLVTESSGTMTTADSSTRFSHRTYSTAATSVSSFVVDDSSLGKKSSKSRKLVKRNRSRSRSPAPRHASESDYGPEDEPADRSLSRRRARSLSAPRYEESIEYSDVEDVDTTILDARDRGVVTESEMDLSERLELARHNSQKQPGTTPSREAKELPIEGVIYEDEPPPPTARRGSRASRMSRTASNHEHDTRSLHSSSTHYTSRSVTPTPVLESTSPRKTRAESFHSSRDCRPVGPRAPSPLPPSSPVINAMELDIEGALESTLARMSPERPSTTEDLRLSDCDFEEREIRSSTPIREVPSRIPRGTRRLLGTIESAPADKHEKAGAKPPSIVPLTIKKKALSGAKTLASTRQGPVIGSSPSVKSNSGSEGPRERAYSTRQRADSCMSVPEAESAGEPNDFVQLTKRTREDLESSQRALKRIRLEVNTFPGRVTQGSPKTPDFRTVPLGQSATPSRNNAATKEAQERMQEMHAMIGRRKGFVGTPRTSRPMSIAEGTLSPQSSTSDMSDTQNWAKTIDGLASCAESDLSRAMDNYLKIEDTVRRILADCNQSNKELDKTLFALQYSRDHSDKLEEKLAIASAEIEAMYGEFNAELENLFKSVTSERDEAWVAMCSDLSETKKERFRLKKEKNDLKERLQEVESRCDEWASLLRSHGLIPS
ncbi:hypothetical protein ACEPAF_6244 [Sanghuangporus sanghuang]